MATLKFEEILPWFAVNGTVDLTQQPSTGGFPAPVANNRIIQVDQPCDIRFKWSASGILTPFLNGNWHCKIYLEQMGKGEFELPGTLGKQTVAYAPSNPSPYDVTMNIPANTVSEGVYRVVCTLTFTAPNGTPGPIAAFSELGLIQFYKA